MSAPRTAGLPGPAPSVEAIRLQLRSWPEVEQSLQHCRGVIVPLGSTEQHGPTGAIGTDALAVEEAAIFEGQQGGPAVSGGQWWLLVWRWRLDARCWKPVGAWLRISRIGRSWSSWVMPISAR